MRCLPAVTAEFTRVAVEQTFVRSKQKMFGLLVGHGGGCRHYQRFPKVQCLGFLVKRFNQVFDGTRAMPLLPPNHLLIDDALDDGYVRPSTRQGLALAFLERVDINDRRGQPVSTLRGKPASIISGGRSPR